jgi:hypothetical protein
MSAYNIYLIDNLVTKQRMVSQLIKKLEGGERTKHVGWKNGFDGVRHAWRDSVHLARAVGDQSGIVLLDISLEGEAFSSKQTIDETNRRLCEYATIDAERFAAFLRDDNVRLLYNGAHTALGVFLLGCCHALNRRVIVTSTIGLSKDISKRFGIPNVVLHLNNSESALEEVAQIISDYIPSFDTAASIWDRLYAHASHHALDKDWFATGVYHEVPKWLRDHPDINPLKPAKLELVAKYLTEMGIKNVELGFEAAISTLKRVGQEEDRLSVALVKNVLGIPLDTRPPFRVPFLKCRENPGRVLLALHLIVNDEDPATCRPSITLPAGPSGIATLKFVTTFDGREAQSRAERAVEDLNSSLEARIAKRKKKVGAIYEACHYLKNAVRQNDGALHWQIVLGSRPGSVEMSFGFYSEGS